MSTEPTGAELLDVALEAAEAAVALVRERAGAGVRVAATKSSDVDVVTQADRDSEALIRSVVLGRRPDDAFLGEEGDDVVGTTGVRWVVDPIDGTVNFLYGLPQYAVSIAAELDGRVVAGVVVDVAKDLTYTAYVDGAGAIVSRCGDRVLAVRGPAPLSHRLISSGFSYDARVRELQAHALTRLIARVRDLRRFGSCSLDICAVADGQMDGYVEEGVNLWDYAAAGLVARGAGARLETTRGVGGGTLVLCAPTHGFAELRDAVTAAGYLSGGPGGSARWSGE